mmetsp:Transcript_14739/g.44519  ORF Transcript_14739/g.44519 Transcript_14739/m.44519 type:complete len:240 (+) Transcript_14739:619-1338(+)
MTVVCSATILLMMGALFTLSTQIRTRYRPTGGWRMYRRSKSTRCRTKTMHSARTHTANSKSRSSKMIRRGRWRRRWQPSGGCRTHHPRRAPRWRLRTTSRRTRPRFPSAPAVRCHPAASGALSGMWASVRICRWGGGWGWSTMSPWAKMMAASRAAATSLPNRATAAWCGRQTLQWVTSLRRTSSSAMAMRSDSRNQPPPCSASLLVSASRPVCCVRMLDRSLRLLAELARSSHSSSSQ